VKGNGKAGFLQEAPQGRKAEPRIPLILHNEGFSHGRAIIEQVSQAKWK
jgi:hypothetical protein